jgi:hypothetical protein
MRYLMKKSYIESSAKWLEGRRRLAGRPGRFAGEQDIGSKPDQA